MWMDMTKLVVALRNSANAPKIRSNNTDGVKAHPSDSFKTNFQNGLNITNAIPRVVTIYLLN